MSLEVTVPPVGESITEVTVARWAKEDGAQVAQDEVLCELESDKATFELNAPEAGILRIVAQEQAVLEIGALVCRLDPIDAQGGGDSSNGSQGKDGKGKGKGKGSVTPEAPSQDQAERSAEAAQGAGPYAGPVTTPVPEAFPGAEGGQSQPKGGSEGQDDSQQGGHGGGEVYEIHVPTVGESITEVTIAQWMAEDGAEVAQDEVLCEIESDKATFELTAERPGRLEIVAARGTTLAIGDLVCRIHTQGQGGGSASSSSSKGSQGGDQDKSSSGNGSAEARAASSVGVAVTPVAANILAEKGIDPGQVRGTGPQGRITKEDALKAQPGSGQSDKGGQAPAPRPQTQAQAPAAKPAAPSPAASGERRERREPMSSLRRTVARRLVAVKNETAMLTTFNEVDMKPIMDIRSKYKDAFKEKHEVGLGFMSFFARAICQALSEFPAVNARIEGQEIVFNDYVDLSIAVSAPKGLMVPVIRNAHDMSFAAIEKEILRLAGRARDSKLSIEEMQGGTFTITNGGVFGSMMSTPIINAPQSAILGMHNIVERAVVQGGQIVIRPIMYVALSYDHRIIDGKESVSFLVRVKQLLEDPARLLLGV